MSLELILHYKLRGDIFLCFSLFRKSKELFISAPTYECDRGLDQMICAKSFFFLIRIYAYI